LQNVEQCHKIQDSLETLSGIAASSQNPY